MKTSTRAQLQQISALDRTAYSGSDASALTGQPEKRAIPIRQEIIPKRFSEVRRTALPASFSQPVNSSASEIAAIVGRPSKLVLLLDYDGTLMENTDPYTSTASEPLKTTIRALTDQPDIHTVVVSGRDHAYHFRAIPEGLGVHRIANHGADFLRSGATAWETLVPEGSLAWKAIAESTMTHFTACNPGTEIEMKTRGVTLHCEQATNSEEVELHAEVLARELRQQLDSYDVKVEHSAKVVEIRENTVDKGTASIAVIGKLLGDNPPADTVIIAAGDADTDEGMFKAFSDTPSAITIRVGPGDTSARWRVAEPRQIRDLLSTLSRTLKAA